MDAYDALEKIEEYVDAFIGVNKIAVADYNGMPIPIKDIDIDLKNKTIMIYVEAE